MDFFAPFCLPHITYHTLKNISQVEEEYDQDSYTGREAEVVVWGLGALILCWCQAFREALGTFLQSGTSF
jgi:3-dehydroquinate dehydratase